MFEHSVKVPRNFKIAANILKKVSTEGGSVKTLLYENKLRHFNKNVLFALITKTIQHAGELDKIFELCSLFKNEPRLDPWVAKVLATELLFGKKTLPGNSKPEQTIISYKEQLEKYTSDHQEDKSQAFRRPRYVRINTNLLTTSDAIRAFQDEGYRFIRCTSSSYDVYLQQIQQLTEYDFTQDYHVKYLFVFAPGSKLHEHELYLENKIVLQDKATSLAVHLLAPPAGSVVLDMCAAPGMKTTQLAAFMRNQGKIYAVERNEKRYETLCDFVERTGSKCVETLHQDALELKRGDYDDVEYILLDPSCSGSGMELSVHNYIEDTRLAKLTSLQEKFLKHAMNAFPKAKRIVYSTCSLFHEENERVITNVVKTSRAKWRVLDVKELLKGQWNNFGSGMYGSIGARCMYAKPDSDLTTGFFLAVLDRDAKDLEKNKINVDIGEGRKKFKRKDSDSPTDDVDNQTKSIREVEVAPERKNKKKKKDKFEQEEIESHENEQEEIEVADLDHKRKRKKYSDSNGDSVEINDNESEECVTNFASEEDIAPKKKKKKDKHRTVENESTEATDVQEGSIKSKKKRKYRNENEQSSEDVLDQSDVTVKKKKKKKDVNTEVDDSIEPQNVGTEAQEKKKKMKRSKNLEIS